MRSLRPNGDLYTIETSDFVHPSLTGFFSNNMHRPSVWRSWNRLSQLQRTLIVVASLTALLSTVYVVNNNYIKRAKYLPAFDPLEKSISVRSTKIENDVDHKSSEIVTNAGDADNETPNDHLPNIHDVELEAKHPPEREELPLQYVHDKEADRLGRGRQSRYQSAIVSSFKYAWEAYRRWAWGRDELQPITKSYSTWFDLGLTIVDSLDTMWIMNLREEFKRSRDWVAQMVIARPRYVNLFEVTIRILGGFLSAYHMSGDKIFLDKAEELGNRLLPAFSSPSGVPYSDVNLATGEAKNPQWSQDSSTSEVSSLQLEFSELTYLTGDPKYRNAALRVSQALHDQPKSNGLVPIFINPLSGSLRGGATVTLGARGDSYYEYLVKHWLQSGKSIEWLLSDFLEAYNGITTKLVKLSEPNKLLYVGELLGGHTFSPKMDHLVCFLPGVFILGIENHIFGENEIGLAKEKRALDIATNLTNTCYKMYSSTATGLSPEIAFFNMASNAKDDIFIKPQDSHYLLRPETIEALFYMYRHTKDPKYRKWGWNIYMSIEKHTKQPDSRGYCSLDSVLDANKRYFSRNKMESFFLAETLKYLYLLFSDDTSLLPLNKWVFNTEGHPFPLRSTEELAKLTSNATKENG